MEIDKGVTNMNIIDIIKELRILIVAISTILATVGFNWAAVLPYVYEFNIHLMFMMSLGFGLTYFLSHRGDKALQSQITATNDAVKTMLLDAKKARLRVTVKQTYNDYANTDDIGLITTQKYILDLERQMAEIGVNSFSSDMINQLKSKFKIR